MLYFITATFFTFVGMCIEAFMVAAHRNEEDEEIRKQIGANGWRYWIPVGARSPEEDDYILISYRNFSIPDIGRYENGQYYAGDDLKPVEHYGLHVNAWMPLPDPHRED